MSSLLLLLNKLDAGLNDQKVLPAYLPVFHPLLKCSYLYKWDALWCVWGHFGELHKYL